MKSNKKVILIFVISFLIIVIPIIVKVIIDINSVKVEEKISSIEYYGYSLSMTDTKAYKDVYEELDDLLKNDTIDYKVYAQLISKLFVIDVFTLNNKLSSTDVGGLEFVHKDLRENFKENLGSTLYSHVLSNIDGKRNQKLPVVSSVSIESVFESVYEFNGEEYSSYLIKCGILYEEDMGYQNMISLTIINIDNVLYIVKGE